MIVARAPGRLDVMGGIADYSGSLVLQLPLDRATTVTLEPLDEPDIVLLSDAKDLRFRIPVEEIQAIGASRLAQRFPADAQDHWLAYVLGVAHSALVRQRSLITRPVTGFALRIESSVPEGKGISSSAALEVACYGAIARHLGITIDPANIAAECQWAENHVAGAPCGIMDQMTSACGIADHLLRLRCQPATIEGHVAIPDGYRFFGIDSGIRHAVTGSDYGTVRTAAFMGYRIIAGDTGADPWNGYLANMSPAEFSARHEHVLPESISGADFLARHGDIHDTVTRVDPERRYPVRVATAHPVFENARVERFATLLGELAVSEHAAGEMGRLMFESHASYGACGLGSDGTDTLVALAREAGPARGIYGAKITGGGSGGTVAILARADASRVVQSIAEAYTRATGWQAEIFAGSSGGLSVVG